QQVLDGGGKFSEVDKEGKAVPGGQSRQPVTTGQAKAVAHEAIAEGAERATTMSISRGPRDNGVTSDGITKANETKFRSFQRYGRMPVGTAGNDKDLQPMQSAPEASRVAVDMLVPMRP